MNTIEFTTFSQIKELFRSYDFDLNQPLSSLGEGKQTISNDNRRKFLDYLTLEYPESSFHNADRKNLILWTSMHDWPLNRVKESILELVKIDNSIPIDQEVSN